GVDPPRNYLPQKKIPADLRSLPRGRTELCIKVLAGIVSQEALPPAARVSAASALLDRGASPRSSPRLTLAHSGGSLMRDAAVCLALAMLDPRRNGGLPPLLPLSQCRSLAGADRVFRPLCPCGA